ncbi:MAG TPA: hypothetical protein VFP87_08280 [Chitinophagaceae bacterium]|nr:hypothetical protein [Chitinophagaceae bacterium]
MKLLILITVFLTSILLATKQKNIEGTWIIDPEGKKYELTVLRIQMKEGSFAGTLDIPGQQVYDKPVTIGLDKDSVKIIFDTKETCFVTVALADSVLAGTSVVSGKASPVTFYRAMSSRQE